MDWGQWVTWALIILGWNVPLYIFCRNKRISANRAIKEKIINTSELLVELAHSYWIKKELSHAQIILYNLTSIEERLEKIKYSTEKSDAEKSYRKLKQSITSHDDFRATEHSINTEEAENVFDNISTCAIEFKKSTGNIPDE